VRLLAREGDLAEFELFHFGGHWFEAGIELAHAIQRVVGEPKPRIRRFPWTLAYALSPFVTVFGEMLELRYLWQRPIRLDNTKLVAFLGTEPHTPIDGAVRNTLEGLRCLRALDPARGAEQAEARACNDAAP